MIHGLYFCSRKQHKKNMTKITIAKGDGIGPEIMDATIKLF